MNRSFSKIRHIQESNQQLEKRMLNENISSRDESGDLNLEFNDSFVLLRDLTQKKVQHYLSKMSESVNYLVIMDCQGVDFSDVDICSFNQLIHINLSGTPNNFEEFNDCGFEEYKPDLYSR